MTTAMRGAIAAITLVLAFWFAPAASAQTASVLGPLASSTVSSPAASHLISYDGDWAMDLAGSGDVHVRLSSAHGISLRVERISAACTGGRQGGTAVRVRVYLNGASVALLVYSHLADVAVAVNQTLANGTRLGRAATGLPRDETCWTGPHVHFEARNDSGYACYTPLGAGAAVGSGTTIGQIGAVGGSRIRQPCGASGGANPKGHYDEALSPEPGTVRVRGWAYDPDAPTSPADMHVYLGGQAGQAGTEGRAFTANALRPDVGRAFPGVGDHHGLDRTFETGKRGSQSVCLYAITIGGGSNVFLGCKTVSIANPDPIGHYDGLGSPAGGSVRLTGWAFDPNAPTAPAEIHVYIGGRYGEAGLEGHSFRASVQRPDVAAAHPGAGAAHGFAQTLQTAKRGSQPVCAYAINRGPGANVFLGCKTVTIAAPATPRPRPTATPTPTAAPVPAVAPPVQPSPDLGSSGDPAFAWTTGSRIRARRTIALGFACRRSACRLAVDATIAVPRTSKQRRRTYRMSADAVLSEPGRAHLRLRLPKGATGAIRHALRAGRKVRARLDVTLVDLDGRGVDLRRTLRFKLPR